MVILYHANKKITAIKDAENQILLAQKIAWQEDEPYGGILTLTYDQIFKQTFKNKVLVLLVGQGIDEQWAGDDYYTQQNEPTIQRVSKSSFKTNVFSDSFLNKAEKPKYPKPLNEKVLNKKYSDLFFTKIPRALRFNDRIFIYSKELREPFWDYRLVEFAFSLPFDSKIKDGVPIFMLRKIAVEYLGNNLAFTPKRALQTPQREWLGKELKEFVNTQLEKIFASESQKWFDKTILTLEWENYLKGDNESSFHIWQWVCLGLLINFKNI